MLQAGEVEQGLLLKDGGEVGLCGVGVHHHQVQVRGEGDLGGLRVDHGLLLQAR